MLIIPTHVLFVGHERSEILLSCDLRALHS